MSNKKYLYGAAVQGIQGFIFGTNKLKEIVGASELIEQICTDLFYQKAQINKRDSNIILSAAGNIKYVFDDEQKCKDFVKIFPKSVSELAPGVTISQAVIEFEGDDFSNSIQKLEDKLKEQRNIVAAPLEIGFMGLERARRTSGVAVDFVKDEALDDATLAKINAGDNVALFKKMSGFKPKASELAFDTEEITKSGKNSWIAVIHADGNGLGQILQNKGKELVEKKLFEKFSNTIEESTKNAIKKAFDEIVKNECNGKNKYPIRPIIIGGDDVTIIIRADLALSFTKIFLEQFELESSGKFKEIGLGDYFGGLTACAGIAYIKESYPLHYGLSLAEKLCSDAKKYVKRTKGDGKIEDPQYGQMPKSAIAFYKVQDSFVDDLKTLKQRTLQTKTGLSYYVGPYKLSDLDNLYKKLQTLKAEADKNDKTKAVSKLRQIVSESYKDVSTSIFMMERMKEVNENFYDALKLEHELEAIKTNGKSQLLDFITLHSFNYGNKEN
ncbi:MAG: hypothetical protein PHW92_13770 [Lutibacter sp.]|nr:hypothetical protein [Lutibacter sp.]